MRNMQKEKEYILVTGGAGFIGSNFIPYFMRTYPGYNIINLDILSYAANVDNLKELAGNPRHRLVKGDVCDRELLMRLFAQYDIQGVIHFAAETHVDKSINDPDKFIKTNVEGTFTVLEAARRHWMETPGKCWPGYETCRFHHISTDEVYGSLGAAGYFTEESPCRPSSPYSASKAAADMVVMSYSRTYGMNVVISRCSNNYGPKQHGEKFIPTIIRKALAGEKIPLYGDGKNIRDWLYVLDHCRAIDLAYHRGRPGEIYNVGGGNERENFYVVRRICGILDQAEPELLRRYGLRSFADLIEFVADRPGHDRRYALDASKIESKLGFKTKEGFEEGLIKTVEWYMRHE